MDRRHFLQLSAGTTSAMTLSGCRKYEHLRYRLTVEMRTPTGMVSGSTVREFVHGGKITWLPGGDNLKTNIIGEALAIDLPRITAFMPFDWSNGHLLYTMVHFGDITPPIGSVAKKFWGDARGQYIRTIRRKKARIELSADNTEAMQSLWGHRLQMVVFQNPENPSSMMRVDLANMERLLGQGVGLSRYILDVTRDDISSGLKGKLPWFPASEADLKDLDARNIRGLSKGISQYPHSFNDMFMSQKDR